MLGRRWRPLREGKGAFSWFDAKVLNVGFDDDAVNPALRDEDWHEPRVPRACAGCIVFCRFCVIQYCCFTAWTIARS